MKRTFRHTAYACYLGMISQAIVNNLAPILFIVFKTRFGLSDEQLGRLIMFNFLTQILADLFATKFCDRIGFRVSTVAAHILCALGLIGMCVLPMMLGNPYVGLSVAAAIYAIGGGLIEVIVSPIVESLPGEEKDKAMSMAHSFYCWGQMAVVLVSTVLLRFIGDNLWYLLPVVWAIVPALNALNFATVPLQPTVSADVKTPVRELMRTRSFRIAMIMMICAGSSELAMSQWASLFAETTLGVSKVLGDLLGPCLFAVFMGIGRTGYGIFGDKIRLDRALVLCSVLCIVCYCVTIFVPVLSFVGCALCGFSVALMWPGTTSSTARRFPLGGTTLFGILAVCGDIGCSIGPWLAGAVSDLVQRTPKILEIGAQMQLTSEQIGLKIGLFSAIILPIGMLVGAILMPRMKD